MHAHTLRIRAATCTGRWASSPFWSRDALVCWLRWFHTKKLGVAVGFVGLGWWAAILSCSRAWFRFFFKRLTERLPALVIRTSFARVMPDSDWSMCVHEQPTDWRFDTAPAGYQNNKYETKLIWLNDVLFSLWKRNTVIYFTFTIWSGFISLSAKGPYLRQSKYARFSALFLCSIKLSLYFGFF